MKENVLDQIIKEFGEIFQPLVDASEDENALIELLVSTGWDVEQLVGHLLEIQQALKKLKTSHDNLISVIQKPPQSLDELEYYLDNIISIADTIQDIPNVIKDLQDIPPLYKDSFQEFPKELMEFLIVRHICLHHPILRDLAGLLTIIQIPIEASPVLDESGKFIRYQCLRPRLHINKITELLSDPVSSLRKEYLPNQLINKDEAKKFADKLFPRLESLFNSLGLNALYGIGENLEELGNCGNALAKQTFSFFLQYDLSNGNTAIAGASILLSPPDIGNFGLIAVPFGQLKLSQRFGDLYAELNSTSTLEGFAIGPQGFLQYPQQGTASSESSFNLDAKIANLVFENEEPKWILGPSKGTHVELDALIFSATVDIRTESKDYGFLLEVPSARFVLAPVEGNSFVQEILQKKNLSVDFDFALGWSNRKGLYFRGGVGLDITIPVNRSVLNLLNVNSVNLALLLKEKEIQSIAAVTVNVKLGPVAFVVGNFGLSIVFEYSDEYRGNLGPIDLEIKFSPPKRIGLTIDTTALVGGGYLDFDEQRDEYAGMLQIELDTGKRSLSLKAMGLLTTRLPDGSKGFSFLIIIMAEDFVPPIQLGYGFTLNGIGGLLGIDRTVTVDVLRSGIKKGTLDSVLFPEDPIRNVNRIISDLRSVFPPAKNRYIFGPMAIIGWGTPTVMTLELGIVLEFQSPLRILRAVILGQFRAFLPDEKNPLVRLQIDAIGEIDFQRCVASIYATMYDSKIMECSLSGDAALKADWGSNPSFLLAVGGFNPRFEPPASFPKLERISLSLGRTKSLFRLETYLALTSNTAQIGARLDIYVKAAKFSVEGYFGFDALFQFSPFQFVADVGGGVALKYRGRSLVGVQLAMTLTGLSPWHARGKATFKILGFKKSVRFSLDLGAKKALPSEPEAVNVMELLIEELNRAGTLAGQLPQNEHPLATFRQVQVSSEEILIHPLSEVIISERLVPLGVEISKFGNARVKGDQITLQITSFQMGSLVIERGFETVKDHFARSQFWDISDEEKLSLPSFEKMDSGIKFGLGTVCNGEKITVAADYDEVVIYPLGSVRPESPESSIESPESPVKQELSLKKSVMERTGRNKYRAPGLKIVLEDIQYLIATDDMVVKEIDGIPVEGSTYTASAEALKKHLASNPKDLGKLQIVARHEVRRQDS